MNPSLGPLDDVHSLRGAPARTLRPLSAIAATRKGGVPEPRLCRILIELAGPLSALHRSGRIHGAITYDSIGLDAHGRADLIVPPLSFPRRASDNALREGRASGFNAFEQYTDDPAWPVGPWTDVYALCATACRLITGAIPPSAIDRCVRDGYVPLAQRELQGYSASLLAALDHGLAMHPHDRPCDLMPLLVATGLSEQTARQICRDGELFEALDAAQALPTPDRNPAQLARAIVGETGSKGFVDPAASVTLTAAEYEAAFTPTEPALPTPGSGEVGRRSRLRLPLGSLLPTCRLLHGSTPWFVLPIGLAVALLGMWGWLQLKPPARSDAHMAEVFPALSRSASVRPVPSSPVPEPSTPSSLVPEPPTLPRLAPEPSAMASSTRDSPALAGPLHEESAGQASAGTPALSSGAPVSHTPRMASETASRAPVTPPIRVAVDIRPWGEVYIDGIKRGVSPPL
ncbi:MAG: hypothetical protein WC590_12885, partial [Burkholderiaceae bacterium]